ncbi:hypothetical protein ABNQ38_06085 (plasmid) [Azospirillum sp. A29]|uniref:hypothetical protein n=1 Tax=Azospirillum sp. A29 TaxID=3160606 RepID=UPI00366D5263
MDEEIGLLRYNSIPILCDHILDGTKEYYEQFGICPVHSNPPFRPHEVKTGDAVFVKTDLLPFFESNVLRLIDTPFVLVTGVSDITPDAHRHLLDNPKVLEWWGSNLPKWSSSVHQLPIGFTEKERPYGRQSLILDHVGGLPWNDRPIEILCTFLSKTSVDRSQLPVEGVFICESRMDYRYYLALMGMSKFVLCPQGNGVDTIRVWESLATGAIPIVTSGILDPLYQDCGCAVIPDWSQIRSATEIQDGEDRRQRTLDGFAKRDGILFLSHWRNRMKRLKTP